MSIQVVKKEETMKSLLAAVFFGCVLILFHGWALSLLWGWYVAPIFGAPNLSIVNAIGISTLVQSFFASTPNSDSTSLERVLNIVGSVAATLFLGWLLHFFM